MTKKSILLLVLIMLLLNLDPALAKEIEEVRIKLGSSYNKISSEVGTPIKLKVTSSFWGNKKALYKLDNNYCIIEYVFGRAKNVLFLEQVSEKEALEKFDMGK